MDQFFPNAIGFCIVLIKFRFVLIEIISERLRLVLLFRPVNKLVMRLPRPMLHRTVHNERAMIRQHIKRRLQHREHMQVRFACIPFNGILALAAIVFSFCIETSKEKIADTRYHTMTSENVITRNWLEF